MNPDTQDPKASPLWVGVGILALILIAFGVYWSSSRGPSGERKEGVLTAPSGQIVEGFPKELILEPGAFVENSYRVDDAGMHQPVLSYISNRSFAENLAAFHVLLETDGWQIMRDADPESPVAFIYAEKGNATLNLTFDARSEKGVTVTETYAIKQ